MKHAATVAGAAPALKKKIEVEPLSEARWSRIERAVLDAAGEAAPAPAAPAPPRWRFAGMPLVLAGAAAAVVGAVAWRTLLPESHPAVTRVETAANGSRVEFSESTIDVGPESAVRLTGDVAHGVVVYLERGRVECDVAPRHGRPPFVVDAGPVEVRVVGTHFGVVRRGDGVTVDVERGAVEVTSQGVHTMVEAGSHWPKAPEAAAPAPEPAPAPEAPRGTSPTVSAAAPGTPASPSRAAAALSPREQYETASRLEARQPDAALAMYRELAQKGGAWGKNALFAEGRLEVDRGNDADARVLLREYLARYPSGPNAGDARHLLERLR